MRYRINGKPVRHLLGTFPETGVKAARQIAAALRAQDAEAPLYLPPGRCLKLFRRSMKGATQRFTSRKGCGPIAPMFDANCCPLSPGNGWMPSPDKMLCGGSRDTAQGNRGSEPGAWHLSQILRCAKTWGYVPKTWRNPVTEIRMNRRRQVGTFLSERQMTELGAVLYSRMARGCKASAACSCCHSPDAG
jgi:hypothetical protein